MVIIVAGIYQLHLIHNNMLGTLWTAWCMQYNSNYIAIFPSHIVDSVGTTTAKQYTCITKKSKSQLGYGLYILGCSGYTVSLIRYLFVALFIAAYTHCDAAKAHKDNTRWHSDGSQQARVQFTVDANFHFSCIWPRPNM